MPTLKGTEASLSYVQGFSYPVSSSINVSIFHITGLDTSWTDLVYKCCWIRGSFLRFYLFIFRERGQEGERERKK